MTEDPLLRAIEAHNEKNFTAGNLGDGSVHGLAPYDLVGQRYQNAEQAERDSEEDDQE